MGLFSLSLETDDRTRRNGTKLCQGRIRVDIKRNLFTMNLGSFALQEQRQRVSNFILDEFAGKVKGQRRVRAGNERLLNT